MYFKYLRHLKKFNKQGILHSSRFSSLKTAANSSLSYNVGEKIHGFRVQQVQEVPELDLTAVRLRHQKTGADFLHLDRRDSNNVFSVAFKTVPKDNSGVAHILEHLALCGSQRYPVRDPFFKMLTRSLATFMNAFTGPDYTMYPFSTQNPQDFQNLLQVYLDAAFFPNLSPTDFRQEGWRLEHENVEDPTSPLVIKGVVYNEMKGVLSDPSQIFGLSILRHLFPDQTYRYNFGGDPNYIPSLTHERLKEFHSHHYHPSNARFFTYGDFPLTTHLEVVNDYVLSKFSSLPLDNQVTDQPHWTQPRSATVQCRHDPMAPHPDKQTTLGVSFLLNRVMEHQETFDLAILCSLLVDGPNSPFHKALIESGLGMDYCPDTGFGCHTRQTIFTVGLHGIHSDDVEKVHTIIDNTFENVIKEGFPQERVEALLHSIELSTKHQQDNFGLKLASNVNVSWNHGGDPIQSLCINKYVASFREKYQSDSHFLQNLVKKYFKDNTHKLTLVMSPTDNYEETKRKAEEALIAEKTASLKEEDKQKIYQEGIELQKSQKAPPDLSCLPSLQLSDISPQVAGLASLEHLHLSGDVPLQLCQQPTNGVTYLRLLVDVSHVPAKLQPLLPLFSSILTRMGAADLDYRQLDQAADLKTSGLSSSLHLAESPVNASQFTQGLLLSSYCLEKNLEPMLDLWSKVILAARFNDNDRLYQLVKALTTDLAQSLAYEGHRYAIRLAASSLSPWGQAQESFSGLTQVVRMKELAEKFNPVYLFESFKEIANLVFSKQHIKCALNGTHSSLAQGKTLLDSLIISSLSSQEDNIRTDEADQSHFEASSHQTHFIMPFDVNYVSKAFPTGVTLSKAASEHAGLKLATKLLSSKFLHREIREQGGAYGSGARVTIGGLLNFYSYRDPNVERTLKAFDDSIKWLAEGSFSSQDLGEAKLSTLQEIDSPVTPGNRGMSHFLNGISDSMRQKQKNEVLVASKESVLEAAHRYLVRPQTVGISLLGPETDFTKMWRRKTSEDASHC